jgi:hypothetical protein
MIYGRELPGYPYDLKAKLTRCIVAGQRKLFGSVLRRFSDHAPLPYSFTGAEANRAIRSLLLAEAPCMVARFGSGEMETTLRALDVTAPGNVLAKFGRMCAGRSGPFWWDNSIRAGIVWIAGFFPEDNASLEHFGRQVTQDCRQIDLLAGWLPGEKRLSKAYFPAVKAFPLIDLEPWWSAEPWSAALEGKTVLVVHPFSDTIRAQYAKRAMLFKNPSVLPEFELKTYRTVQSLAGLRPPFPTWFDALKRMCDDIAGIDFDIALIGAGAYGMSIAAFIKRDLKRKAVHMGGATQLLFGIKGHRWNREPRYVSELYNKEWIPPFDSERPEKARTVEGGSYW